MDCVVELEKHMTVDSLHSPSSLRIDRVKEHRKSFVSSLLVVLFSFSFAFIRFIR